jgi:2,3-bisphosphoglycerate-dependent phosphoglycerate mutase
MASLVLLRHGESQWNLEDRFTGWVDVPLTSTGEVEARHAGERLKAAGFCFHIAFSSALQRTVRTLDIVLDVLGQQDISRVAAAALNERHYGELQGLNKAEAAQRFGAALVAEWRRSYAVPPPHGESLKDTATRVLPYFEARILPPVQAGQTVLVVAHGNSLRALVMQLDHLSPEEVEHLDLHTGMIFAYRIDVDGRVLAKQEL